MALSFTFVKGSEWEAGRLRGRTYDVQFDAAYVAGGEPMTPDDVGLINIIGAHFLGVRLAAGGSVTSTDIPVFNTNNGFLQLFETGGAINAPLAEAGVEDVSANLYRIMFLGQG
jgi:hypothetical protein